LNKTINEHKQKIDELELARNDAKKNLDAAVIRHQKEMEDANKEVLQNKTCRFLLDQRAEEVIKLKKELEETKESLRVHKKKLNAKEAECTEIKSGNDKFKDQNFQLKKSIGNLREKLQKLEEDNAELKAKKEKFEEETRHQIENRTLSDRAKINKVKAEKKKLKKAKEKLDEENVELKEENEDLAKEKAELEEENVELKEDLERHDRRIEELEEEIRQKRDDEDDRKSDDDDSDDEDSVGEEARGCKLFVYGVSESVSREELEQEFGKCGSVTDAYNPGKGYAFVTYSSTDEADRAVKQLHGTEPFGRTMTVKLNLKPGGGRGGRGRR